MTQKLDVKKTVKKSNILNEVRNANASPVEYRLFCVYLAHLQMNNESNVVTFSLADYARIAGLDRPRYDDLKEQAENIVRLTGTLQNEDGGFSVYSLFSEFRMFKEDGAWMVSLECNPKIAPRIREQGARYIRYKLYNTLYLKSFNQQRLYELLKQYEKIGERTISLKDLREYLSIGESEYSVWGDFAQKVLKISQKALRENTDIYFDFEPVKNKGKTVGVRFLIHKNKDFVDRLQMDKFLPSSDADVCEPVDNSKIPENMEQVSFFSDSNYERASRYLLPLNFTADNVRTICDAAMEYLGESSDISELCIYLVRKVEVLKRAQLKETIKSPVDYLLGIIANDAKAAALKPKETDGKRQLDADELAAIDRMMEEDTPKTVGTDAELAARAASLKEKLSQPT